MSEEQPRDEQGRFASEGGGLGTWAAAKAPVKPPKVGETVRVNLGRQGGVQEGKVTSVHPTDGTFRWNNGFIEQRAKLSQITTKPPRGQKLDPYMKKWNEEPGE